MRATRAGLLLGCRQIVAGWAAQHCGPGARCTAVMSLFPNPRIAVACLLTEPCTLWPQVNAMQRQAKYFIHGRGRGHASRSPAVLRALSAEGYQVELHAGGDAAQLLASHPEQVFKRTPLLPGPAAPLRLLQRSLSDAWSYGLTRPDVIVSDGDQSALLASRVAGIPSLAVGHDLVFGGGVRLPPLPRAALLYQRLNAAPVRAASRAVAVHFLPCSSSEPNLRVARPEPFTSTEDATPSGHVVSYFRDPCGARVVQLLAMAGVPVQWFGAEAASTPRVQAHPICATSFRAAVRDCEAVVGSAGSNLLAECVLLKKPVLALYKRQDSEQLLNASLIEQAQVGMACAFEDINGRVIEEFVERVRSCDFAQVDLSDALPPLSQVVAEALADLATEASETPAFA